MQMSALLPKKIAIIGANGFIGSALSDFLAALGVVVVQISRQDFTDIPAKIHGCDAVVILAALTPKRGLSTHDNNTRFMDNLRIAEKIYNGIYVAEIPQILYVSTDAVYGNNIELLQEKIKSDPACLYGLAHAVREKLLLEMFNNREVCIIRPCAIFGSKDPHNGYGPNRFLREATQSRTITLFGHGEEKRNHLFILDLIKIIVKLLSHKSTGIFNVASKSPVTFLEVAQQVQSSLPFDTQLNFVPRLQPIQHKVHDLSNLEHALSDLEFTPLEIALGIMYKSSSEELIARGAVCQK